MSLMIFPTKRWGHLKKNQLKPHLKKQWCIGQMTPEFLWQMETILHLYQLPYNPMYPVVCIDERLCQLIDDIITPIPMKSDKQKRQDYHYKRNGVASLFIAFEPLTGQRIVEVRDRRTKADYAHFLNKVAQHYPNATQIRVVQVIERYTFIPISSHHSCHRQRPFPNPSHLSGPANSQRKSVNLPNSLLRYYNSRPMLLGRTQLRSCGGGCVSRSYIFIDSMIGRHFKTRCLPSCNSL